MKLDKKTLVRFMIISFCIIVFETLNSFYLVKSIELYEEFHRRTQASLNDYITSQMLNYVSSVSIYVIFNLYNYFLYDKIQITLLYKGIFSLFIISNILFKIFVYPQDTLFYFLSIIGQIILLIWIIVYKERKK